MNENNNKKYWGMGKKNKTNLIFFNLLIAKLILILCPLILICLIIRLSHSHYWIWTVDLKLYVDFF